MHIQHPIQNLAIIAAIIVLVRVASTVVISIKRKWSYENETLIIPTWILRAAIIAVAIGLLLLMLWREGIVTLG